MLAFIARKRISHAMTVSVPIVLPFPRPPFHIRSPSREPEPLASNLSHLLEV